MTTTMRITFLVTTFASFIISLILTLQILGSFALYRWDISISLEDCYYMNSSAFADDTLKQSSEDVKKEIKEAYSGENWAFRLISGNIDKDVSIIIYLSIATLFVCSTCGVYYISYLYKKVSKKGRRA